MKQYTVVSQIGKIVVLLLTFVGIFKGFCVLRRHIDLSAACEWSLVRAFHTQRKLAPHWEDTEENASDSLDWKPVALVICSVIAVLVVFEGYLRLKHQETATAGQEHLTMPEEWQLRETVVEGQISKLLAWQTPCL